VTLSGGLSYDRYRVNGFDEWLVRIGDAAAPKILFLPALFEEMNRTRAFTVGVMRRVAAEGYCCVLPDLPGTGESERELGACRWDDWREAAAVAGEGAVATVSVRGGALLDDAVAAQCRWRLAPVEGASLARDLARSNLAGGGGNAGYPADEALLAALAEAKPAAVAARRVRLEGDSGDADMRLEGAAIWRRSEPHSGSELAALSASDIVKWVRQCAGF
jgi:pimeloyl-ACP methyl ester carboxylesterase